MTITKTNKNETTILEVVGRLDMSTSARLHDVLIPTLGECTDLIIDFGELVYVSSAGLRVLLLAQKEAQAKGKTMVLQNVAKDIMEVFEMTGFDSILTFE